MNRKYSQEFKQGAVDQAGQPNVTLAQVAKELGLNPGMLGRWRFELSSHGRKAFKGQGNPRDEELSALKRELARVKKERDFLREAATYFAKESVIPPFLTSVKTREFLGYSSCRGGTPPIAECGRILL